jgi:glycosyltransferase involved in cell wall biosynthesis
MRLSVVVPTLNARDKLVGCLDALTDHAPDAEIVVVNGPSADGTTGMVRDRSDVDVLVEVADRRINVARNAGIDRATGDVVALLNYDLTVTDGWRDALLTGIDRADVVTGPTLQELDTGVATEEPESRIIKGRTVSYFNGDNVAFTRETLDALDGFDEYLHTGGARDAAHRLAGMDRTVDWNSDMCARREYSADGGVTDRDWEGKYRSLAYRLAKNYGVRPTVLRRLLTHGVSDAVGALRDVATGSAPPSSWLGNGRDVLSGMGRGLKDGARARLDDRTPRRNPDGRSARTDRAVAVYTN